MIEALITLLPGLCGFFNNASKRRRLHDEPGRAAVRAILRAVNETRLYQSALARGERRDSDREAELSRCWTDAAANLHGIDRGLAGRCRLKGEYWTEADKWDKEQLKRAEILLEQVAGDANALLGL